MKIFLNLEHSYYISNKLYRKNHFRLAKFIMNFSNILHSSDIDYRATIGRNVHFAHRGLGIIIHKDAIIGDNCHIMQQVTIGGKSGKNAGVPVVGNNVFIGIGSTILGNIEISDDVRIGAHAVVLIDAPKGSLLLGVPAKIHK